MAESDAATGADDRSVAGAPSSSVSLAWIAAVAWAVALVATYVAAHPEIADVPRDVLGIVRAAHVDGAAVASAAASAAVSIGIALAIVFACYGYGRAAGTLVPESDFPPVVLEAAKLALGLGVGAILIFAAGKLRLLVPASAAVVTAGGLVCLVGTTGRTGARRALGSARSALGRAARDRRAWPALVAVAVAAASAFAFALAPPTARDALAYHLAVPKAYLAAGAIVEWPANVYSYLPFAAEMLYAWAMLFGSSTAPAVVHAIVGGATAAVLYAYGERLGGAPSWGALAAAMYATVPSVVWTAGLAHNETFRCLAVTLAVVGVGEWFASGRSGSIVWAGVGVGLALGVKHTELVLLPALALVVLVRLRGLAVEERGTAAKAAVAAACVAAVLPLPWYLQNVAWTGNPLYPYFWGLFPTHSAAWTAERAADFENYLRQTYGNHGVIGQLRLPFDVSLLGQDDVPRRFDGVLGPAFLLVAPAAAWLALDRRSSLSVVWRVAAALCALGFVAWASQSQQIRFLLALAPAAALVSVAALASGGLGRRVARVLLVGVAAVVIANTLVLGAGVVAANPIAVAAGLEPRDAYLRRRLGYTDAYATLEALPPPVRVMLVDMRNDTFYLDVPAVSDYVFEDATIGRVVNAASSPEDVAAALRALGVTHLLVRHDILLDPNLTPFLTESALNRYRDFLRTHGRLVRIDPPYTLIQLEL